MPAAALSRLHMDPEGPTPGVGNSSILDAMPAAAVDAFLAEVGPGSTSTLLAAELRQLGGALGRPHPNGGALDRLPGEFMLFGVAVAPFPEAAIQGRLDADRLVGALQPWSNGRQYLNFAETPVDPKSATRTRAGTGFAPSVRWSTRTGCSRRTT